MRDQVAANIKAHRKQARADRDHHEAIRDTALALKHYRRGSAHAVDEVTARDLHQTLKSADRSAHGLDATAHATAEIKAARSLQRRANMKMAIAAGGAKGAFTHYKNPDLIPAGKIAGRIANWPRTHRPR